MLRALPAWPLALLCLLAAACSAGAGAPATTDPVVFEIPWQAPEVARYRIIEKDRNEEIGTAELRVDERGTGELVISQSFEFPRRNIVNHARVTADAATLKPRATTYSVEAPEGPLDCSAEYGEREVTILHEREDQEPRDFTLDLPEVYYDTWTDLYLWRTIPFGDGYEVTYNGMLTCSVARPERIKETLEVREVETVTVPAGSFEAWRLHIRSSGVTQRAWYSTGPERELVLYDNGDLIFELVSIE